MFIKKSIPKMVHYHSQVEYTILDVKIQGGF
nr:MAG TPA: hypothetical protein [Caudoviricetes sp.]